VGPNIQLSGKCTSLIRNNISLSHRNVQKYAHARLDKEAESSASPTPSRDTNHQNGVIRLDDSDIQQAQYIPRVEVEPPTPSVDTGMFSDIRKQHKVLVPASRVASHRSTREDEEDSETDKSEGKGNYLRSKLWWLGLFLMAVGESANFISYGLAAASVVAPLGTVGESVPSATPMFRMGADLLLANPKALIANCFISPLMLNERFGWRDAAGVILAALGAVTVVLSAKQQDREV
jgi:hypothetical protein